MGLLCNLKLITKNCKVVSVVVLRSMAFNMAE